MQRLVSSDGSSSENSEDEELPQPSQSGQSAQTATIKRSIREGLPELGAGVKGRTRLDAERAWVEQ
eukprot:6041117-Pleurochrysis_carterae.AAC.1